MVLQSGEEVFLDKIFPPYVIFNIIFISITALLVALGKGDKNEK